MRIPPMWIDLKAFKISWRKFLFIISHFFLHMKSNVIPKDAVCKALC